MPALKPKSLILGFDLLLLDRALSFQLCSFKGTLVSCPQFGIVEDLTARSIDMLDVPRDDPHLLGNRGRCDG
ncbi:hypothetical protein ACRQ5Q_27590 [Bradyrhizobium sp. PMVTL-01]|uniref:hypothetical protein n=1 Tax=Bradyrhizobium sp. PMVTL-01 TaxID=3434999 RepID=UPI003F6ECECF